MKEGPDIAIIGSLIGDPARANMLAALVSGKALTASELAGEAGITLQTASTHLKRLEEGGLISQRKQGRHRYFSLTDADVAEVLEVIAVLAAKRGHLRTRTGPRDPALRHARICYDHLAGDLGVRMLDSLLGRGLLQAAGEDLALTDAGAGFAADCGIDTASLAASRRPLCRSCLDWSARRSHLAGALGAAFLEGFFDAGWAQRQPRSRIVAFTPEGERRFLQRFPV